MKKVLVAIPFKQNLNPDLRARMCALSARLMVNNPGYEIDLIRMANNIKPIENVPFSAHCQARNLLLDTYLKDHDLVMWIDADLVDYPPDIITQLDKVNPGGVTAPVVLIEGTKQFYDTYGYRQNGKPVSHISPYFDIDEKLIDLDAVGCAYLIPASIYKNNRYETTEGQTEHYSIMQAARNSGMRVACFRDMVVYHANLPLYGEVWHGH